MGENVFRWVISVRVGIWAPVGPVTRARGLRKISRICDSVMRALGTWKFLVWHETVPKGPGSGYLRPVTQGRGLAY